MSNLQRKTNACYGIEKWLKRQGFKVNKRNVSEITYKFLKEKGLPCTKYNPRYKGFFSADICNSEAVQENFNEFKEFVLKQKEDKQ